MTSVTTSTSKATRGTRGTTGAPASQQRTDPIVAAYRQAATRDGARPPSSLRTSVLAHARALAAVNAANASQTSSAASGLTGALTPPPPVAARMTAANDPVWMWRAAAGVVLGVLGALTFQWLRPGPTGETALASAPPPVTRDAPAVPAAPAAPAAPASVLPPSEAQRPAPATAGVSAPQSTALDVPANDVLLAQSASPTPTQAASSRNAPAREASSAALMRQRAHNEAPLGAAAPPQAATATATTTPTTTLTRPAPAPALTADRARPDAPSSAAIGAPQPLASLASAAPAMRAAPAAPLVSAAGAGAPVTTAPTTTNPTDPTPPSASLDEPMFAAIRNNDAEALRSAIARGANVNATTSQGRSPLQLAREHNHNDLISILTAAGAKQP